jgi:hypothetical protein
MRCYPVSTRINHLANDDVEYSKPHVSCRGSTSPLFVIGIAQYEGLPILG